MRKTEGKDVEGQLRAPGEEEIDHSNNSDNAEIGKRHLKPQKKCLQ